MKKLVVALLFLSAILSTAVSLEPYAMTVKGANIIYYEDFEYGVKGTISGTASWEIAVRDKAYYNVLDIAQHAYLKITSLGYVTITFDKNISAQFFAIGLYIIDSVYLRIETRQGEIMMFDLPSEPPNPVFLELFPNSPTEAYAYLGEIVGRKYYCKLLPLTEPTDYIKFEIPVAAGPWAGVGIEYFMFFNSTDKWIYVDLDLDIVGRNVQTANLTLELFANLTFSMWVPPEVNVSIDISMFKIASEILEANASIINLWDELMYALMDQAPAVYFGLARGISVQAHSPYIIIAQDIRYKYGRYYLAWNAIDNYSILIHAGNPNWRGYIFPCLTGNILCPPEAKEYVNPLSAAKNYGFGVSGNITYADETYIQVENEVLTGYPIYYGQVYLVVPYIIGYWSASIQELVGEPDWRMVKADVLLAAPAYAILNNNNKTIKGYFPLVIKATIPRGYVFLDTQRNRYLPEYDMDVIIILPPAIQKLQEILRSVFLWTEEVRETITGNVLNKPYTGNLTYLGNGLYHAEAVFNVSQFVNRLLVYGSGNITVVLANQTEIKQIVDEYGEIAVGDGVDRVVAIGNFTVIYITENKSVPVFGVKRTYNITFDMMYKELSVTFKVKTVGIYGRKMLKLYINATITAGNITRKYTINLGAIDVLLFQKVEFNIVVFKIFPHPLVLLLNSTLLGVIVEKRRELVFVGGSAATIAYTIAVLVLNPFVVATSASLAI